MKPGDVASKEFVVGVRGYVREEVRAFLRAVSQELTQRDARIERLRAELAALRERDRKALHRLLGDEVSAILDAAHEAGTKMAARERRKAARSTTAGAKATLAKPRRPAKG